jgi:putative transposase
LTLKALRKSEKKLKREQKKLSRKQKGFKNRRKQKTRLARVHEHVANQRRDFLHKESRRVVNSHDGFAFEKLRVKNMLKNHTLAKAMADAGWSTFLSMVAYKAERAGKPFVLVDPHNTTQICSRCGAFVPKKLSYEYTSVLSAPLYSTETTTLRSTLLLGLGWSEVMLVEKRPL